MYSALCLTMAMSDCCSISDELAGRASLIFLLMHHWVLHTHILVIMLLEMQAQSCGTALPKGQLLLGKGSINHNSIVALWSVLFPVVNFKCSSRNLFAWCCLSGPRWDCSGSHTSRLPGNVFMWMYFFNTVLLKGLVYELEGHFLERTHPPRPKQAEANLSYSNNILALNYCNY